MQNIERIIQNDFIHYFIPLILNTVNNNNLSKLLFGRSPLYLNTSYIIGYSLYYYYRNNQGINKNFLTLCEIITKTSIFIIPIKTIYYIYYYFSKYINEELIKKIAYKIFDKILDIYLYIMKYFEKDYNIKIEKTNYGILINYSIKSNNFCLLINDDENSDEKIKIITEYIKNFVKEGKEIKNRILKAECTLKPKDEFSDFNFERYKIDITEKIKKIAGPNGDFNLEGKIIIHFNRIVTDSPIYEAEVLEILGTDLKKYRFKYKDIITFNENDDYNIVDECEIEN